MVMLPASGMYEVLKKASVGAGCLLYVIVRFSAFAAEYNAVKPSLFRAARQRLGADLTCAG